MAPKSILQDHHQAILEAIGRGELAGHIAERYHTTIPALRSYLGRRGIRLRTQCGGFGRVRVDIQKLKQLRDSGHTLAQCIAILGVSQQTIVRRVASWGLPKVRTGPRLAQGHRQSWGTGRSLDKHGYIRVYAPLHPHARRSGAVAEHRLVKEVELGRYLLPAEVVHHHDDHPAHNWPSNLGMYASNGLHLKAELTGRKQATPRASTPGAYGSNQKIDHCPDIHESMAQASSEMRVKLEQYIDAHRPTTAQQTERLRDILRSGPHRPVFQSSSMD